MGKGTMTWMCLLLAAHAAAAATPEATPMNQRSFKIPFRVRAERQGDIDRVILYVSRDRGASWEMRDQATPDRKEFQYTAPADGVYWFTVAVRNRRGEEEPRDVSKVLPSQIQKILVDTTRPEVRILSTERRGDTVALRWQVQEDNPDPSSLRVEYTTADRPQGPWTPVGVFPESQEATFRPGKDGDVLVRVQVKDAAGNAGEKTTTVTAAAAQGRVEMVSGFAGGPQRGGPEPLSSRPTPPPAPVPAGTGPDRDAAPGLPGPALTPVPPVPAPNPPVPAGPAAPPAPASSPASEPTGTPPRLLQAAGGPGHEVEPTALAGLTRGSLPSVQIVNKRQVKLGFDVSKLGPSGLGGVEVYVTTDEGATWGPATVDRPALPQATDGPATGPVHGSVTVALNKEGVVHGFYLVIKSRAGLGKPPPQRGEPPQVRLELDMTRPQAALYAPQPDRERPNTLVLNWKAWDRNLPAKPVVLEWAEQRDGPWAPISPDPLPNNLLTQTITSAEQLGNVRYTGSYAWQLPDKMPPKVYLRLKVRDTVGWESVAQTAEPVLIDLTVPELGSVSVGP
jgi:hypothetical protein